MSTDTKTNHLEPLSSDTGTNETVPHIKVTASHIARGTPVPLKYLINILNYIHFSDGTITAVYRHPESQNTMAQRVKPMPCSDANLFCRWKIPETASSGFAPFRLDHLQVEDDMHTLWVKPEMAVNSAEGLRLRLLENCIVRMAPSPDGGCSNRNLRATVFQNGIPFLGRLLHFSANSFWIDIHFAESQNAHWIRSTGTVYLVLADDAETYYSGTCQVEGEKTSERACRVHLSMSADDACRFKPKEYRSKRVTLSPSPDAVFRHPLNDREYAVKVEDLSGSGFSVVMDAELEGLFVGLIIPGIRLEVAGDPLVQCKGQVVNAWSDVKGNVSHHTRFGIAILDIDVAGHMRLQEVVQRAGNPYAYMSRHLDLQALWRFFFESGFIYPEKYRSLADKKYQVQKVYEKLYLGQPHFARHFVFQKDGAILGHVAMLRTYANAWMIHHHAALLATSNRAGLSILDQIGQFINESHKLAAMHMDFIFCFYRPDNKFPHRVFGGAARSAKDPAKSSLDEFSFGHYTPPPGPRRELPEEWELIDAREKDLEALVKFYQNHSGGLMLKAFDLLPGREEPYELSLEYERIGFTRRQRLFTLTRDSQAKVVFEVNLSDAGMNMSDLMNCVRIYLVDEEDLGADMVAAALHRLTDYYDGDQMTVMAFPPGETDALPFSAERTYVLWVLNLQYTDTYFAYMNRLARFM